MQQKSILKEDHLRITLMRLCQQLIENHDRFENTVALGLQPRGIFFAKRLAQLLKLEFKAHMDLGYLDTTFHRDDFRRRDTPKKASTTDVPFVIEERNVVLIDDVLYTGRSVRAALDAMITFGRPKKVELMVLIDRSYNRDLPIEANYIGRKVNTLKSSEVKVEWRDQGFKKDAVWLFNDPDKR